MPTAVLYQVLEIDTDAQTVRNPDAAYPRRLRTGLQHLIVYTLSGGLVSAVGLWVGVWIFQTQDPDAGLTGVFFAVCMFAALAWGVVSLPLGAFWGIRSLTASVGQPDLSSPERALKSFLFSIRGDMPSRAWDMLTDQAKQPPDVPLPGQHPVAEDLPQPEIRDLDSFKAFWSTLGCLDWKARTRDIRRRDLDKQSVVLTCPFQVDNKQKNKGTQVFEAEFLLVRRKQDRWFLANAFVWPM